MISPYYETELGKLYHGDCLEILPQITEKIDLTLTDPPYGVNLKYDVYNDTDSNWELMFLKLLPELKRISSMSILPSCQIKKMPFIYKHHPPDWLICWYKGSPGHAGFVGFNDWEPHLVYGKNNTNMHDYFHATPEPQTNGHPCQKPLKWALWLIERATKPDNLILDPFLGSGTTAVACERLGRRWIGIDISKAYCDIAVKRIEQERRQLKLL
jgi:DNA modification methylase